MSGPVRHWWTGRWLEPLEQAGPAHARQVARGQALARRGAVEDLSITTGRVTGSVREGRGRPARVELRWATPPEAVWDAAVAALSAELRFTAALLEGSLPDGLDEVLADAGVPLFPDFDELQQRCTCAQRPLPCRHVVAVHAAAGARFDRDPFLLLELRGRSRDWLLRELRAERNGDATVAPAGLALSHDLYAARGDLDAIELRPAPLDDPAALVAHLGPPPGVADPAPVVRLVERAAETAWRLAAGAGTAAADEEVLLAELRAQRIGTAASLAAALGRTVEEVRRDLDRLFEAGSVMRTGSGADARYRAAASSPVSS